MGQHKHNETAKLAKAGLLPPKPQRLGKPEIRRRMQYLMDREINRVLVAALVKRLNKTEK
jgi:hypothetical protein